MLILCVSCCLAPISLIQMQVGNAWFSHRPICSASIQSFGKETIYIIWRTRWSVTEEKTHLLWRAGTEALQIRKSYLGCHCLRLGVTVTTAEWVGIMLVLHLLLHCTAHQVTSKHVWCWVQLDWLLCTPSWASSNSLLTWRAGDLQQVTSVTVTSSAIMAGSRRSLVAACSLLLVLWNRVFSLHILGSVGINTAGPVLLHVNSIG